MPFTAWDAVTALLGATVLNHSLRVLAAVAFLHHLPASPPFPYTQAFGVASAQ